MQSKIIRSGTLPFRKESSVASEMIYCLPIRPAVAVVYSKYTRLEFPIETPSCAERIHMEPILVSE